ncbi:MAG TPA: hypothetical protein PK022_02570 [Syntrophales bacterium]|nr:hypothetical protein [Syntrophales bacterium]
MKKILVIYYSQTGQLKRILDSLLRPLAGNPAFSVECLELEPAAAYPFPWTRNAFLEVFPESVLEKPIRLKPWAAEHPGEYDLVILAFQPWYLSPSLPVTAFLQSPAAERIIRGADVLTVIGARNMWVKSFERVKERLENLGGRLRGNVVLVDRAPNLVSVVTICYWMFTGKKDRCLGFFPPPGVSDADIAAAGKFGEAIGSALTQDLIGELDEAVQKLGSTRANVSLARLENRAKKIFFLWANAITKRPRIRKRLLNLFFVELILALAIISPVNSLLGLLFNQFHKRRNRH